jgi:hypothetical protein
LNLRRARNKEFSARLGIWNMRLIADSTEVEVAGQQVTCASMLTKLPFLSEADATKRTAMLATI